MKAALAKDPDGGATVLRRPLKLGARAVGGAVLVLLALASSQANAQELAWPDEMEAVDPEAAPPDGYHRERRGLRGVFGAGAATFGAVYLGTVIAGVFSQYSGGQYELFVPVIGPLIATREPNTKGGEKALLATNSIIQTAGAVMMVVGLTVRRDLFVLDPMELRPVIGPGFAGLSGSF